MRNITVSLSESEHQALVRLLEFAVAMGKKIDGTDVRGQGDDQELMLEMLRSEISVLMREFQSQLSSVTLEGLARKILGTQGPAQN